MTEEEMSQALCMMALANEVLKDSKPCPPEIMKVLNEHFWESMDSE